MRQRRRGGLFTEVFEESAGAGFGERRVVDGAIHFDDRDVFAQVGFQRVEQGEVGGRVVKFLAGRADDTEGFERQEHGDWTAGSVEFFSDDFAELRAFVWRGAHQSDLRIVLVEVAALEFGGNGIGAVEIHHVEAAGSDDGGDRVPGGGFESSRAGGEKAADEFIRPFGGRDVEYSGDKAGFDERFHGPAASAGGVENEDFVTGGFENFAGGLDAVGGIAEHAGDDERFVGAGFGRRFDHAADGAGGTSEDLARDAIEAGDVHDAGKHDDVLDANILGGVAAGEGGHHEFGKANGQGTHRRRADGRAAAAAERDDPINLFFGNETAQDDGCAARHDFDGFATIAALDDRGEVGSGGSGQLPAGRHRV
jgi:hypothetical protein